MIEKYLPCTYDLEDHRIRTGLYLFPSQSFTRFCLDCHCCWFVVKKYPSIENAGGLGSFKKAALPPPEMAVVQSIIGTRCSPSTCSILPSGKRTK